jgi:hypothetical protein
MCHPFAPASGLYADIIMLFLAEKPPRLGRL